MEILTYEDFVDMENIDKQYFSDENIQGAGESFEIYLRDPNHIRVVRVGGRVVGYITALALNRDAYENVKSGRKSETEIAPEDLSGAMSYLYLGVVAIDKAHRDNRTTLKLYAAFRNQMREAISNGAEILEVMTEPITPEGKRIATEFFKMAPATKTMYTVDGKTFTNIFR
jgi:hypothetical protein